MNLYSKFNRNWTMGKRLKIGGKFQGVGENSGEGGEFRKKNANVTYAIPKLIYAGSFIQIGQWKCFQK